MDLFDPRTIATPVYERLSQLRSQTNSNDTLQQQRKQAVELYTYLSTWGLLRLKAEEMALNQEGKKQEGKKQVVKQYFQCLETLADVQGLSGEGGLKTLKNLPVDDYLGLTGLGLAIALEFSFWATAVYADVKGE
ncbi:hypothetical protein [Lyngbya confervoides]|uniref:Uncharacterized protein n=1 Tax=Lyngbya confervoides BDU141951 TaxID=1574623 RepID=A0ABD4T3G1_9CYAN|nr:hypothetical protein [Lyngbya confervoides]MCM1982965.1 hypothetical protein [Lyngbya confervoides BDU141951]